NNLPSWNSSPPTPEAYYRSVCSCPLGWYNSDSMDFPYG
ncbi:hypothetical protein A2U01_0112819, partial [Trifolium medium]|nr:hypothetical protein [Trifolium medium]